MKLDDDIKRIVATMAYYDSKDETVSDNIQFEYVNTVIFSLIYKVPNESIVGIILTKENLSNLVYRTLLRLSKEVQSAKERYDILKGLSDSVDTECLESISNSYALLTTWMLNLRSVAHAIDT